MVFPRALIGIASLAMFCSVAEGRDRKAEAQALAKSAEVFVSEGRWDQAVDLFLKAYDLYPAPVLLYNAGFVYEKKGEPRRARQLYERYLSVETDRRGKKVGRQHLDAMLDAIPGRLRVTGGPAGAEVAIDGKPAGVIPLAGVELKRGIHDLRVGRGGYTTLARSVRIEPDLEIEVTASLELAPGSIRVTCDRTGATVEIDGKPAGVVPLAGAVPVPAGLHSVGLVVEGRPTAPRDVVVSPGREVAVSLSGPAIAPPARTPVVSTRGRVSPWPWVAIATGSAVLVGGGVLGYLAWKDSSSVKDARRQYGVVTGMTQREAASLERSANSKLASAIVLGAVGAAAVVTGTVLAVRRGDTRGRTGPLPVIAPTEGGIAAGALIDF